MQGWNYSKDHLIRAGVGAGTSYQQIFKVYFGFGVDGTESLNGETVAKVYCGGKCKVDFTDLRFGNLGNLVYLHKICSSVASSYAVFAVQVSESSDEDRWVRVWYGNASAADVSSDNALVDVIGGVVLGLPMNENAGEPQDYSGNNLDGTLVNATWENGGKFATKGIQCVATNTAYISVPDNAAMDLTTVGSFMFWYKPDATSAGKRLFSKHDGSYALETAGVGSPDFVLDKEATATLFSSAGIFNDGVWVNVVITKNNNDYTVYKNGLTNAIVNIAAANWVNNGDELKIGGNAYGYANGLWSGFYIFNTVLTEANAFAFASGYADPSLVAGSVLVRKWATTTLPTHDSWTTETYWQQGKHPPRRRGKPKLTVTQRRIYETALSYLEFKQQQRSLYTHEKRSPLTMKEYMSQGQKKPTKNVSENTTINNNPIEYTQKQFLREFELQQLEVNQKRSRVLSKIESYVDKLLA